MRIAQIAPLDESVPPKLYAGTERIVSYLTEELVAQGHDASLFASSDSQTSAQLIPCCSKLIPCCSTAYRLNPSVRDALPRRLMMLKAPLGRADEFDVMHFHSELLHLPIVDSLGCATVTTLHCHLVVRNPLVEFVGEIDEFRKSISLAGWRSSRPYPSPPSPKVIARSNPKCRSEQC